MILKTKLLLFTSACLFLLIVPLNLLALKQNQSVVIDNKTGDFPLQQVTSFDEYKETYISLNDFAVKTGYGICLNAFCGASGGTP